MNRFCQLVVRLFRIPSGVMCINITNNKRHFFVAEEVRDRCVVTSAATARWRNVDAVDVQLLAIGHCNHNAVVVGQGMLRELLYAADFVLVCETIEGLGK